VSVEIKGAEQLAALSKALKAAGEKDLQRELSKAITTATRPVIAEARRSALNTLPRRGGLAAKVAKSSMRTQRRVAGVRILAKNAYALGRMDKGQVRHRVFGRDVWVTQQVRPGWWTKPTEAAGPEVRKAILEAMDAVAAKIARSV
jgi:hypothetical protein